MQSGYPQLELLESVIEEQGALHLYRVQPGVFLSEAIGDLSARAGESYCRQGTAVLAGAPTTRIFNDWGQMKRYSSEARSMLTKWAAKTLHKGSRVDFFTTAALVSMGISTASIALVVIGIDLKNHQTLEAFKAELQQVSQSIS